MVKKITPKRLENIALYYLQRYESSTAKLRAVLKRRILRAKMQGCEIPEQADIWIEDIIRKMVDLGYVNDIRYAQNTFRRLHNAGKSTRFIAGKLKQDGITPDDFDALTQAQQISCDELDLNAARRLVDKKKLGFHRSEKSQKENFQKDLAVLGRAGFSYEIACAALKDPTES